ncbi:hypothetical protein HYX05_02185 [Candidatus Woesearchaeota archaeon]|nr:hypothetical protein [Candidatus Woesearchaeota archaeon]
MYNPQLSRREFLRGAAGTAGAVEVAGLYDKAIAAGGAVGGLAGIFSSPPHVSAGSKSGEISGINELREHAKAVYQEYERTYRGEPLIFNDFFEGRKVKLGVDYRNGMFSLEAVILVPPDRAGKPFFVEDKFVDFGIKEV